MYGMDVTTVSNICSAKCLFVAKPTCNGLHFEYESFISQSISQIFSHCAATGIRLVRCSHVHRLSSTYLLCSNIQVYKFGSAKTVKKILSLALGRTVNWMVLLPQVLRASTSICCALR